MVVVVLLTLSLIYIWQYVSLAYATKLSSCQPLVVSSEFPAKF
jgi:hypothetical protein